MKNAFLLPYSNLFHGMSDILEETERPFYNRKAGQKALYCHTQQEEHD